MSVFDVSEFLKSNRGTKFSASSISENIELSVASVRRALKHIELFEKWDKDQLQSEKTLINSKHTTIYWYNPLEGK